MRRTSFSNVIGIVHKQPLPFTPLRVNGKRTRGLRRVPTTENPNGLRRVLCDLFIRDLTATERRKPPPPVLKEDGKLSVLDSSVHDVDRYTLKLYRINGRKNKRTF